MITRYNQHIKIIIFILLLDHIFVSEIAKKKYNKIALFGDRGVGKTSLIYNVMNIRDQPTPSVAINVIPMHVNIGDRKVFFSAWDIAGHMQMGKIVYGILDKLDGAIFVVNESKPQSEIEKSVSEFKARSKCDNIVVTNSTFIFSSPESIIASPFIEIIDLIEKKRN